MSYRFELREKTAAGYSRIVTEQIDRVLSELKDTPNRATAIHEGRKSLKRIRALLRLMRPGLGESVYKAENARFREIAGLFSADRDRYVLYGIADALQDAMDARHSEAFKVIKASLTPKTANGAADHGNDKSREAAAMLKAARTETASRRVRPDSFETIQAGLEKSYREGRKQLRAAYDKPEDEAFHDLRKSVQQHWRHMQVLQNAWPDLFAARVAAAKHVSQILGDDHDLSVFVAHLKTLPRKKLAAAERRAIEKFCRDRQKTARQNARPLCNQLFADRAGTFAKRIAIIWVSAEQVDKMENTKSAPAKPKQKKPKKAKRRGNSTQPSQST